MKPVNWNDSVMTPEDRKACEEALSAFLGGPPAFECSADYRDGFDAGFLLGLHWGRVSTGAPIPKPGPAVCACWVPTKTNGT